MPSTNYAYVNGRFVREAEATVSIFDRGFLYGDGVFETMRVYGGKVFLLDQHVARLVTGMALLKLAPLANASNLLQELIARNRIQSGVVRVYVSRGAGPVGLSAKKLTATSVVVIAQEREFPVELATWRVMLSSWWLQEHSQFAATKTANRLLHIMAKLEAEEAGVEDAILCNEGGWAVELTAANLFAVMGGKISTPSIHEGALPGITRTAVIELAGQLGIPVDECGFEKEFLLSGADELFATNSLAEVVAIREVNGRQLPAGAITKRLHAAYRQLVRDELAV